MTTNRTERPCFPSEASRALDRILKENGDKAKAIRACKKWHRTRLYPWRHGVSKPEAEAVGVLHELSNGEVSATGWANDPELERAFFEKRDQDNSQPDPQPPSAE